MASLEVDTGVRRREVPVDRRLATVAVTLPSRRLRAYRLDVQIRRSKHCPHSALRSISAMFSQLPCLGGVESSVDQRAVGRARLRASRTARLRLGSQGDHRMHHGLVLRVARPEHVAKSETPVPAVRPIATARCHHPINGSNSRKPRVSPLHTPWCSTRCSGPGLVGRIWRISPMHFVVVSPLHVTTAELQRDWTRP